MCLIFFSSILSDSPDAAKLSATSALTDLTLKMEILRGILWEELVASLVRGRWGNEKWGGHHANATRCRKHL